MRARRDNRIGLLAKSAGSLVKAGFWDMGASVWPVPVPVAVAVAVAGANASVNIGSPQASCTP